MRQLNDRPILAMAFTVLALLLVVRGIIPGLTRIQTDFPNYYVAGRIVAAGGDVSRLYDDTWFQAEIRRSGMDQLGKFSPFPPPTALFFVPLSVFTPLTALRLMTVLNIALLFISMRVLSRVLPAPGTHASVMILLSGVGLWNCFSFGQLYVFLSACILVGYAMYLQEKRILSGIAFGLLIPVKYYPVVFLLYFALVREWRIVLTALVTAAAATGLSVLVLGWEVHREFLAQVLGSHLASHYSGQTPYATAFQSWDSLLRRLFVADAVDNPHPLLASPQVFLALKSAIVAALIASAIPVLLRIRRTADPLFRQCAFAMLGILPLLVAPGTATYHFVLLWLPCGLLLHACWAAGRRKLFSIGAALYAVLGFIPYGMLARLGEQWSFWPLAYPRLFVVLGLFLVSLTAALAMLQDSRETVDDRLNIGKAMTMREA